jgi:hypothetical protein
VSRAASTDLICAGSYAMRASPYKGVIPRLHRTAGRRPFSPTVPATQSHTITSGQPSTHRLDWLARCQWSRAEVLGEVAANGDGRTMVALARYMRQKRTFNPSVAMRK